MSQAVHYLKPVSVNNEMPFTRLNESSAVAFDFHHLFHLLLRKWWVIALLTVLSVGAAVLYLLKAPKVYESTAVIEFENESGQAKLTQLQSALEGELLERQANLTKAQAARDSASSLSWVSWDEYTPRVFDELAKVTADPNGFPASVPLRS